MKLVHFLSPQAALLSCALAFCLAGCASAQLPATVVEAESVSESKAALDAKKYAPHAHAAAEKLRAEAHFLFEDDRPEEAAVAGEQAIAAFTEAFVLTRVAKAEERIEAAQIAHKSAEDAAADLDELQGQIAADADAFEMRARVHLDTEEVKDVKNVSPARARARRKAAQQLTAEAALLCLSARLIDSQALGLKDAESGVGQLETELKAGSQKNNLYPRAAGARSLCLKQLSLARRPEVQKHPESAASDKLLKSLTETGKVFAYRDDRGVVVNIGSPINKEGELTERTSEILHLLGGTAKNHPKFPVLVVSHSAKKNDGERAGKMGEAASLALTQAGAKKVSTHSVDNAQPIVSTRVRGAAEKNERIEVVFVARGR